MRRRVRVVGADHRLHLTEGAVYSLLIRGDQSAGADALVVQAKVFRVGAGDQQLLCRAAKARSPSASSFQTAGEAPVGEIEQR